MRIQPITLRAANDFVDAHHRHNGRTARNGGKFAISLVDNAGELMGVAIVGNPLSATYMNREKYGWIAEVLRVCTLEGAQLGAVSKLYSACWRAWKAMGGTKLITYTLDTESGASLKGAGWQCVARLRPTEIGWRKNDHLVETRTYDARCMGVRKFRWEVGGTQLPQELQEANSD